MSCYFFADIGDLVVQSGDAFGPAINTTLDGVDYEQFQVTSKHIASDQINAIAVCNGQIFVQEQSEDNDLLNIVLKPIDHPPFNFPKISYFIYKGIRKDSLIADNDIDIVSKGTNDLADAIWNAYQVTNSEGSPSKEILGLDAAINNLPDATPIEEIFVTTFGNVQIWNIKGGSIIGKFDEDSIGFEVITQSMFYLPTLELMRNAVTIIKCKSLDPDFSQKDFFDHWFNKESITSFIDPCAFFGSFYIDSLLLLNNGAQSELTGDDLYSNLLVKFVNKNLCYLDIRNEFNFSLNFFKNYGISSTDNTTNLNIKKGEMDSYSVVDYYQSNWPILTIDSTDFESTALKFQTLSLQLPCGNGDNPVPLVFFNKAYIPSSDFPNEYVKWEMFQTLEIDSNYTNEFKIALPWNSDALLSSYVLIKFVKQNHDSSLPDILPTQIRKTDSIDCLFNTSLNFDYLNSSYKTKVFHENIYVDATDIENFDAVFSLVMDFDGSNITLTGVPSVFNTVDSQRSMLSPTSDHKTFKDSQNYFEDISLNQNGSNFLNMTLVSSGNDLHVLQVKPGYNDLAETMNVPDFRKLLGFTITVAEWANLIQISNSSSLLQNYPIYISVSDKQNLTDDRGLFYTSLDLKLIGFYITGDTIQTLEVPTNINLLTYGTF
ncbi:hypothetical protein [Mucilaginibacter sp.]|uniref:hypothetical protein n=1 Tax=Mucilaginibacter sp. TaxID=1882438 RepID=UPI0025D1F273|nr:hypothetical protein [Mucilaginibacter sp.]